MLILKSMYIHLIYYFGLFYYTFVIDVYYEKKINIKSCICSSKDDES